MKANGTGLFTLFPAGTSRGRTKSCACVTINDERERGGRVEGTQGSGRLTGWPASPHCFLPSFLLLGLLPLSHPPIPYVRSLECRMTLCSAVQCEGGAAICMPVSSSRSRYHPLLQCKDIARSCTLTPCRAPWPHTHTPTSAPSPSLAWLPARRAPPDIVLLFGLGKRCQRGLSSVSLFHNLPKREENLGQTSDTRDTRTSPSLAYFTQCHCGTGTSSVARGGRVPSPDFLLLPFDSPCANILHGRKMAFWNCWNTEQKESPEVRTLVYFPFSRDVRMPRPHFMRKVKVGLSVSVLLDEIRAY